MDAIDYGILFMDDQLQARIVNRAYRVIWEISAAFVAKRPSMRELIEYNRYNNVYNVPDEKFENYIDEHEVMVRQGALFFGELERKDGMILQYQCVVRPGQKAIIASGFSETEEVKKAQELGAGSFIHKPYTLEQIGIAVKKL